MKKLALLMTLMLVFTFASFAQIDVTVEGSSELTLGINLDDQFVEGDEDAVSTGFTNTNSSKISFAIVSGDSEKGAEEDVFGMISITGWKAEANSDDGYAAIAAGDVEAKIITPNFWVKISGTNASVGNVTIVEGMDDDDTKNDGIGTALDNSGGFVVGASVGPADVELGVFSMEDWVNDINTADAGALSWAHNDEEADAVTAHILVGDAAVVDTDDSNSTNAYGACLTATIAAGPLSINVGGIMGLTYPDGTPIGATAKVSGTVSIASFYAGIDAEITDATIWEVAGGVSLALMDGVSLSGDVSYSEAEDLDVKVAATANGIVPALNVGLTAWLLNPQGTNSWTIDATADYSLDTAKIYVGFGTGSDEVMDIKVGAELYLITNVTLVGEWATENQANSDGIIKIIAKIAY